MAATHRDTIFALSSGRPPAAIAVIRISGSRAGDALTALGVKIPEPRKARLARIRDPLRDRDNGIIDEALVLWFPGPNSETGEDVAELQLHGGPAVVAAALDALGGIEGLRPAEAGEFTRRAFENGKLDLTAVEGLADLVSAETQGQRRQAFRHMKGLLGGRAETWRQRLIQALALVEARIDFSDEGDVPENLAGPALVLAQELRDEIALALADGGRGERLREGLVVAIAGPPNAGKSTLLNRLTRREAAIVSPYAGTTRDVIEVHLELGGMPVTLVDTAGIRETDDPVELEGVRRARERAAGADLVLWVVDASEAGPLADPPRIGREPSGGTAARASGAPMLEASTPSLRPPAWLVRNKIDLIQGLDSKNESKNHIFSKSERNLPTNKPLKSMVNFQLTQRSEAELQPNVAVDNVSGSDFTGNNEPLLTTYDLVFNLSSSSGDGVELLVDRLAAYAAEYLAGAESALVTRSRHRRALEETLAALRRALDEPAGREDILAEELRLAARALGRLTGRVDVEDVLDVIFRDFCIGK